jgi:biotin carboxyl carrier protein
LTYYIEIDGARHQLSLEPTADLDRFRATYDGETRDADARLLEPGVLSLLMDGRSYRILFDPRPTSTAIVLDDRRISYSLHDPRSLRSRDDPDAGGSGARPVVAPMPGRIVRLLVQSGDRVEAQQGLIVMEAMKMQNELKAPKPGTVARISVQAGTTVQAGEVLMVIE